MGRPAGSKNKPKTFKFNHTNDANQFSITKEAYDREVHKGNVKKPKVNWEKLAKDLQAGLAKEIKENQDLYQAVAAKETLIIQQAAIIQYLEGKLWNIFNSKA